MYDVDVIVAGSGLCGTFAAIAAGRCGAKTLVVERFGSLGGNIGPGMVVNGGLYNERETTLPGGRAGMAQEFIERLQALCVGDERRYPEEAGVASYLAYDMMRAAGVEFLLSAYASDPIMEGSVVKGLFVECRSGRVAARAKVVVDGTGNADIARRAGAPLVPFMEAHESQADYIRPAYLKSDYPTYYNDTQLFCVVAGVDQAAYREFREREAPLSAEDRAWAEETGLLGKQPAALIPALRQAWCDNVWRPYGEIEPGVRFSTSANFRDFGEGLVGCHVSCSGAVDAGDPKQTSRIEAALRGLAFENLDFLRRHAGGFEDAYLVVCAPFLGWRGGPHIEGEHVLTCEESFSGRKCDDVLYRNIHEGANHGGDPSGFDVPYGIVLPRNVDGLLVCGRGAAYTRRGHDPSGMRARPSMMVFGQCVGTAAAVAALDGATPKTVDIRKVQRRIVEDGVSLGGDARLKELGLA